jgi:protein phosphatase
VTVFRAASATDTGKVRSSNQDRCLATSGLVAVADGMGGHVGGEIAARTAIDALQRSFAANRSTAGLASATMQANRAVFDQSEQESSLRGMGTTLTAAAIVGTGRRERVAVANVGDSRAYLLRDGNLVQLTADHSLVEEMVRNGELTPAEAATHPHRHVLTRALGIDESVKVDSWEIDPAPGGRLLLCSDGLTNECSDDEIAAVLATTVDPAAAADRLVALAVEHGGSDNVTVVVADVDPDGTVAPERPATVRDATAPPARGGAAGAAGAARGLAGSAVARQVRAADPVAPRTARRGTPRPAAQTDRQADRHADRVLTVRVALFVVVFVGVLGGAAGFVGWYVRASYFVGVDSGHVAVFEGRPGGFLWFKPSLIDRTNIAVSDVFAPDAAAVRAGMLEPSFSAAEQVVTSLANVQHDLALPSVDTTNALGVVGTMTTTLAPVTTAPATTAPATTAPVKSAPRRTTATAATVVPSPPVT